LRQPGNLRVAMQAYADTANVMTLDPVVLAHAHQLAREIHYCGFFWKLRCLPQSLVLCQKLRSQGLPATLKIGMAKREPVSAHAWVELWAQPLDEREDVSQFFRTFPNNSATAGDCQPCHFD
jgi:Transglutaminase-like superfamily